MAFAVVNREHVFAALGDQRRAGGPDQRPGAFAQRRDDPMHRDLVFHRIDLRIDVGKRPQHIEGEGIHQFIDRHVAPQPGNAEPVPLRLDLRIDLVRHGRTSLARDRAPGFRNRRPAADLSGQDDHREIIILHECRPGDLLLRQKIAMGVDRAPAETLVRREAGLAVSRRGRGALPGRARPAARTASGSRRCRRRPARPARSTSRRPMRRHRRPDSGARNWRECRTCRS